MFMALGTFETFTLEYGRTLGSTCALWSTFKAHGGRWLPYLDLDLRGVRGRRMLAWDFESCMFQFHGH